MYYTECERLAERHPDLAGIIEQVDLQLQEMVTAEVIRAGDFASFLGVDRNQVTSVLGMLAQDGVLLAEEMIECPHCGMVIPRPEYEEMLAEEDEVCCTDCERLLHQAAVQTITTFRSGIKWKGVPPLLKDVSKKTSPQLHKLDDSAWYTHDHLAEVFGVGKDALRKRLDRYRRTHLDGWKENEDRRPREPKYLFHLRMVRHIIEDLQASSERPAK